MIGGLWDQNNVVINNAFVLFLNGLLTLWGMMKIPNHELYKNIDIKKKAKMEDAIKTS